VEFDSVGKDAKGAMVDSIDEIVRRSVRHARRMLGEGHYDWPTTRRALRIILADLEARSPNHASLERLRTFIAANDRAWLREN
jgi:sugar phosphate isomerase/epimerase